MKVPFTADGKALPVPLTPEEADEMRRESDEWDQRLADLLTHEASYLDDRFSELLATGTTTIRSSEGTWTAILQRSRLSDGWLITKGTGLGGRGSSGRTRIGRKSTTEQLKSAITLQLAMGLMWLREP